MTGVRDAVRTLAAGGGGGAPRWLLVVGVLIGVLAVSGSAILIRFAAGAGVDPLAIAFWRNAGGAVALAPFAVRAQRAGPSLDRPQRLQLAGSGVLLALHFGLWITSLELTTVASSVTIVWMSPVFVGIGARAFLGEPPSRRTWIGMAATMAGAVLIGAADLADTALGPRALLGDLLAFGGAVGGAGYLLVGRAARRRLPVSVYAGSVYAVAAAVLLVACLVSGAELTGYPAGAWVALAAMVVGPQLLGHTVFNTLLGAMSATVVSVVVLAEPVGATVLAWLILAELPTALFWVGAPLILAGVAYATSRPRPAPA